MKKLSVLVCFLIGMAQISYQHALQAQCVSGDCINGKGVYQYKSGAKYAGRFYNRLANGFGVLRFTNGDIYEGEWKDHKRNGKGKLVAKGKYTYKGQFRENHFHGHGSLTFENGESLAGLFYQGKYVKDGAEVDPFSSNTGSFVEKPQPNETPDGSEGRKPLLADYKDCNSNRCHNENGRFVYRDGSVYAGEFINGQPEGRGELYYANGDYYKGGWKNHAPDGEGYVNYTSGRSFGAIWDNGKPVRELTADHPLIVETVKVDKDDAVKIWAVIIGVSRYDHMPSLKYTDDDAFHLYAFLKSPAGGALPDEQIDLLIDEQANRKNIVSSMQQTLYRADENDVILLYYSGHGLEGNLIPQDYDGYNNTVGYDEIKQIIAQSKAMHKLVVTDACHSGTLLAARSKIDSKLRNYYTNLSNTAGGVAFLTSSRGEEVSMESSGLRHGIFSHYFIEGLKGAADSNTDGIISISELYRYVKREVGIYTNYDQNPMISGNYDPDMPVGMSMK
jgi:hypothetical protein